MKSVTAAKKPNSRIRTKSNEIVCRAEWAADWRHWMILFDFWFTLVLPARVILEMNETGMRTLRIYTNKCLP